MYNLLHINVLLVQQGTPTSTCLLAMRGPLVSATDINTVLSLSCLLSHEQ